MSISKQARELMAQERQKNEQTQENILERSSEKIQSGTETNINEQARELLVENRQNQKKTQENMLERAEENLPKE